MKKITSIIIGIMVILGVAAHADQIEGWDRIDTNKTTQLICALVQVQDFKTGQRQKFGKNDPQTIMRVFFDKTAIVFTSLYIYGEKDMSFMDRLKYMDWLSSEKKPAYMDPKDATKTASVVKKGKWYLVKRNANGTQMIFNCQESN